MSEGLVTAYVGLGSNAGDRLATLRTAVRAMDALDGVRVAAVSPVYETEAHVLPGQPPQPDHLNAVAVLDTTRSPVALLRALHRIERAAGRDPDAPRWSPRPLDLDLLLYGDRQLDGEVLVLPHPRLAERRFVLQPLTDLAPDLIVPGLGRTVAGALAATRDESRIERTALSLV